MSTEEQNALYRRQARYREAVEPTWEKVAGLTPDEYEQRYLAAWERVYQKHPYYLYPDDRYREEFEAPRLEEVSELSYKNTVRDVQQARADTLQRLTSQAEAVLTNAAGNASRSLLAALLRETAEFISCFTLPESDRPSESEIERRRRILAERPVFETLQGSRFTPVLPGWSGKPDCIVDEPERVGSILGQLEHFSNLRGQFLAAEAITAPPQSPARRKAAVGFSDTPSPEWNALLRQPSKFGLKELWAALSAVELTDLSGKPTAWGRGCKGEWAGAIDALVEYKPDGLLKTNGLAICRCLNHWGISVTENTLRGNTSAGADSVYKSMKEYLKTI
jgi:hypothetical protein